MAATATSAAASAAGAATGAAAAGAEARDQPHPLAWLQAGCADPLARPGEVFRFRAGVLAGALRGTLLHAELELVARFAAARFQGEPAAAAACVCPEALKLLAA